MLKRNRVSEGHPRRIAAPLLAKAAVRLAFVVVALIASRPASAGCAAAEPDLLWSYPADGDDDVPTNAVFIARPTFGNEVEASLNGQALGSREEDQFRYFVLNRPALSPNTEYTLTLVIWSRAPLAEPVTRTVGFRTANGPLDGVPPPPRIASLTTVDAWPIGFEPCRELHWAQECYDYGPHTWVVVELEDPSIADIFVVRESKEQPKRDRTREYIEFSVPSACPSPVVYTVYGMEPGRPAPCYDVAAVWPNGNLSWSSSVCRAPATDGGSGCAATLAHRVTSTPSNLHCTLLLLAMLFLFVAVRRDNLRPHSSPNPHHDNTLGPAQEPTSTR